MLPSEYNMHDFDSTWAQVVVLYRRINAIRNHFVDSLNVPTHYGEIPNGMPRLKILEYA